MAKAWEVPGLGIDVPLERCARLVVDTRFREMMSYRRGTIAGTDVEQLHSMRVGSRRLRSAMKSFRRCFDRDAFKLHSEHIREIADALGHVRDLDVRITWLERELAGARYVERSGIKFLLGRTRVDRERARGPMIELLDLLERTHYDVEFLEFVWKGAGERG